MIGVHGDDVFVAGDGPVGAIFAVLAEVDGVFLAEALEPRRVAVIEEARGVRHMELV